MSSDFYFKKWKDTLTKLEELVDLDVYYQTTKAHDKKRCDAALRLSAVLGQYMTIYNHIMVCLHHNLQVQKTAYIEEALQAVVARILELKHEISKLDASEHQFLNNGLIYNKLTPYNAELVQLPSKEIRPEHVQSMIGEAVERANEKKRHLEELRQIEERGEEQEAVDNWWDEEANDKNSDEDFTVEEKKEELSEEQKEIKATIEIIQAHEKTRQVIAWQTQQYNKRQRWKKEIEGTASPAAPKEIRERSAAIIQKVCRTYFKIKRERYLQCKRDELIGLNQCTLPKRVTHENEDKDYDKKSQSRAKFEEEWRSDFECMKEKYLKLKAGEIEESCRDHIRDWFLYWYDAIKLFYDIPDDKSGGSKLILKEELPTPEEYLEQYKAYLAEKKSNKNKSSLQKKMEKMEANKQKEMDKKAELQKKKLEKDLKVKMMKNPTQHPGFNYPESNKTEHILQVIKEYHTDWDEFDMTDQLDVKERHCKEMDKNKYIMEVKFEVIPNVDEIMRMELKKLKVALKKDYIANDEEMPEPMKKKRKREKKKRPVKIPIGENVAEKMEELVFRGYVKEYPKTKLEDFIGDPNFAGDDVRCGYESALQLHGDTRNLWWDKCRNMIHGFHKILLVGPQGGGKTILLHALASLNDAVLFELDPSSIRSELASDVYLQQIVQYVVSCARAAQPSVIHIKHVHRFYYKKVPTQEKNTNWALFKRHFTKKLFKKIHKTDNITIIGSCLDPWLTKSKQMLKHFPDVVLLPNTSYSTVVQLLNEWVLSNHVVPLDLNVSCLAHVLEGYSFGYLQEFLKTFLSAERISQISRNGLSAKEVFDSLLEDGVDKIEYEKYLKWYTDRTSWGKKEKHHLAEQKEFKQALDRWAQKAEKEKRKKPPADNKLPTITE